MGRKQFSGRRASSSQLHEAFTWEAEGSWQWVTTESESRRWVKSTPEATTEQVGEGEDVVAEAEPPPPAPPTPGKTVEKVEASGAKKKKKKPDRKKTTSKTNIAGTAQKPATKKKKGRPPFCLYGVSNIEPTTGGVIYGNYMRSFNSTCHDEQTQRYLQVYPSALRATNKPFHVNQDLDPGCPDRDAANSAYKKSSRRIRDVTNNKKPTTPKPTTPASPPVAPAPPPPPAEPVAGLPRIRIGSVAACFQYA